MRYITLRVPAPALMLAWTGLMFLAILLRSFSYDVAGLDWDESLYIVIAQRWLAGDLPYVGVWDQHPPGLPAIFALTQWLSPDLLYSARLDTLLAVSTTAALLFDILDRCAGQRAAGVLAGIFYLIVMSRPDGLAGNTEVFNNLFVTAGCRLLLPEFLADTGPVVLRRVLVAALLFGTGLQIKYVILPEAALLFTALLVRLLSRGVMWRRVATVAVAAILAGLLPTCVMASYFWYADALGPFLDANLSANLEYVGLPISAETVLARLRFGLLPICTFAVWPIALLLLKRFSPSARKWRLLAVFLSIWLLAALVDVALPMKFWKHYFNALLPPLVLIAGLCCILLIRAFPRLGLILAATAATLTVAPIVGLLVKHAPDSRSIGRLNVPQAIAARIERGGSNGHDVYVFNYDPLVYAYARCKPPTRFVLGIELADFSASSGARAAREVEQVLMTGPKWIVVAHPSPYEFSQEVWRGFNDALESYDVDATWTEADYIQPPIEVTLYVRH